MRGFSPASGARATQQAGEESEVAQVEDVAATMAGGAQRRVDAAETVALVQLHCRVHAAQGFQVATGEAEAAGGLEAARHHRAACALPARGRQEVHLAQDRKST